MKKKYSLTPEHRALLKPWADKWIANAMSTKAMDDADRAAMRTAIRGLYMSAGRVPPPDSRIVFVPSPFVARYAGGFAAGIWYMRKCGKKMIVNRDMNNAVSSGSDTMVGNTYDATYDATNDATDDATDAATYNATYDATRDATRAATDAATYAATGAATDYATDDATYGATRAATYDATYAATYDATYAATNDAALYDRWYVCPDMRPVARLFGDEKFLLNCAYNAYRMYGSGNLWSSAPAFLGFFRHIAKLDIDYSKWQYYEDAAIYGSSRIMHEKFCIVSDRPAVLKVDSENRPHCDNGPFCQWRDGTALYAVHGVRLPAWIIEQPERITPDAIRNEQNVEIRRIMLAKYGEARYLIDINAAILHTDDWGTLYRADMPNDEPLTLVRVVNSSPESDGTYKPYFLRVPPTVSTAREAVAWTFGVDAKVYDPTVET